MTYVVKLNQYFLILIFSDHKLNFKSNSVITFYKIIIDEEITRVAWLS